MFFGHRLVPLFFGNPCGNPNIKLLSTSMIEVENK
jgi:hypothetical protein